MNAFKYSLKESGIKIWTVEGFKYIKNIYFIKKEYPAFKITIDGDITIIVPDFFRIRTPRGYIKPSELFPLNDAVIYHSENNLNSLRPVLFVEKLNKNNVKEWVFIETENSPIVRRFSSEEIKEKYACLKESGERFRKPLRDIKAGDYVQTGDEFKEVISKNMIDEDEGIIIINMNNNNIFINNICVIPDINFIKNELKQKEI